MSAAQLYSAEDVVLAVARAFLFVREEPRNSNRGQAVEAMQRAVHIRPGDPWCAGYVGLVGRAALGAAWPVPMVGGCATLGDWAAKQGVLVETPQPGDVFLTYSATLKRFAHTGFIVDLGENGRHSTLEGNTNDGGSRDGWGVFARTRTFGPRDRFIRWTAV